MNTSSIATTLLLGSVCAVAGALIARYVIKRESIQPMEEVDDDADMNVDFGSKREEYKLV